MTNTELTWTMAVATFLVVVSVSLLGLYVVEVSRPIWGRLVYLLVDRRSSKRFDVSLPISVYGHERDAEPFFEDATVLQVSAHGGLLTLTTNVRLGQELLLVRDPDQELQQPCRVARVGPSNGGKKEVAIQFARPARRFWLTIRSYSQ